MYTYTVCLHGPPMYGHTGARSSVWQVCAAGPQIDQSPRYCCVVRTKTRSSFVSQILYTAWSSESGPRCVDESNGPHLVCITRMCVCVCVCAFVKRVNIEFSPERTPINCASSVNCEYAQLTISFLRVFSRCMPAAEVITCALTSNLLFLAYLLLFDCV